MNHKWKAVKGKSPTRRDLAEWSYTKFIHFLRFCEFFIVHSEKGSTISVTKERWLNAEKFTEMPDHPFQEFIYRIGVFTTDKAATEKKFYYKLTSMMKFILGYLRQNPALISDEMRKIIEPEPRFNWCLKQTEIVPTVLGEVVETASREGVTGKKDSVAPYEQQLIESMLKAVNVFNLVANSINPKEIEKMDTKDKLLAIARLLPAFNIVKNFKPNKKVFKGLVIHSASREEMEAAILAVSQDD